MYIYIDIVVLLNLCVNTLLLFLTAWILNLRYTKIRLAAAVFILTAYVLSFLVYPNSLCGHPAMKFLVSAAAVFVAFGKRTWREFTLSLGTFYFISFLLGGAALGYYFFSRDCISFGEFTCTGLSLSLLSQGLFFGALLFYVLAKLLFRRKANDTFITKIRLRSNLGQVIVDAFWDSGNQLYDITGNKPVILIEMESLKPLFSGAANQFLEEVNEKEWFQSWPLCKDEAWKKAVAIISYRGIGGANFLLGQRVAQVDLKQGDTWNSLDCVIGIYPDELSSDRSYQALLHSSMCLK